jgi:hypothetical protein
MAIRVRRSDGTTDFGYYASIARISVHPVVTSWLAAGASAGNTTLTAISSFFYGLDTDGITYGSSGKIKRLNLFCGSSLTDCLIPQVTSIGTTTDTNSGGTAFVSGNYTEATGLTRPSGTGSGGNKWLNTGVLDSTLSNSDVSCGAYIRVDNTTDLSNGLWIGAANRFFLGHTGGANLGLYNPQQGYLNETVGGRVGFYVATMEAGGVSKIYRNGTQDNTVTGAAYTGSNAVNVGIFGNATGYNQATGICGGYYIGLALTATQISNLYARIQAFQTSLGRQV